MNVLFVRLVHCGLAITLIGSSSLLAQEPKAADDRYAATIARLASVIGEQLDRQDLPAVSIALIDDQELIWADGFGFEDQEQTRPADADTIFRVGSVSKLFTDIAVMQLVEQGSLDLDTDLRTQLADFRPAIGADEKITLRQLMSHRSGLVRESPVGNYFDPDEPSLAETIQSLNGLARTYPPETRTKYSNAGVAVVGYTLEVVNGKPFDEVMHEALLLPLGMESSGFTRTGPIDERLADAVMWTHDGRTFPAPKFALGTLPAGNLYSSVTDLAKFVQAIFNDGVGPQGAIVQPETLQMMLSPQFADANGNATYGLGFHRRTLDGKLMVGHGGAVYGFSTQLHALPEDELGVVIATSKDGANDAIRRIAYHALRCMVAESIDRPLPSWKTVTVVAPERARSLVGLYRDDSSGEMLRLMQRNEDLIAQLGSYRFRLGAMDANTLVADDAHRQEQSFKLMGSDEIETGGKTYRRMDDALPSPLPARWQGLVGEYGWDHNTLYIFEERGQLRCLIEWFYDYPLQELEPGRFAFPDYGLYHGEELHFELDNENVAVAVTAAQVRFERREIGTVDGETFKIEPTQPIDEVRDIAMAAEPPNETGEFRPSELIEVRSLDSSIRLDIRYATDNNFMGATFYKEPRAFLQRPAAEALVRVHRALRQKGYGLLIHDAYRPWFVTKMFWEATPDEMKIFVANPASGSRHNRGCAVDLTLYDLETGEVVPMGAGYDEFSNRSFPDYPVASSRERWHRELLRKAMEAQGFTIYEYEWWHFDYGDWRSYAIQNATFEELE